MGAEEWSMGAIPILSWPEGVFTKAPHGKGVLFSRAERRMTFVCPRKALPGGSGRSKCDFMQCTFFTDGNVLVASPSGQPLLMGAIVDAVEEVIQLTDAEIEPAPDFGTGGGPGFITGMTTIQGGVKILLNIDKVFLEEGTIAIAAHLVQ